MCACVNVVCKSQKEAGMSFQWTIVNLLHASEQYLGHDHELHSLSGSAAWTFGERKQAQWAYSNHKLQPHAGADPGFKKKGGGHNTLFLGPPPASKVAQVPWKLMSGEGGGGGTRHIFRSATSVESRASHKRGGGGGGERNPTHLCVSYFLYFF